MQTCGAVYYNQETHYRNIWGPVEPRCDSTNNSIKNSIIWLISFDLNQFGSDVMD